MTVQVTVSLTFATTEEAITALAKLRNETAATPTKPAKTDKPAATPSTAQAAPAGAPAPTPPVDDTAAKAAAALHERVKTAITAATKDSANVPKVKGVLSEFGAKTGKDLKPEDYEKFLKALDAALTVEDLAG